MAFWFIAALVALIVVAVFAMAMLRRRVSTDTAAAFDMQVYRDQLKELERDVVRGTLAEDEATRARVEISRRLLEADKAAQAGSSGKAAPRGLTLAVLGLSALLVLGGSFALYARMGAVVGGHEVTTLLPEIYPDLPLKARIATAQKVREGRVGQAQAEAQQPPWPGPPQDAPSDYLDLVAQLRSAVEERPDDLQGQELVSAHEARLGNFTAAHAAKAQALALKGDAASGNDYAQYADLMVLAAGGYVSPEAEQALAKALQRDPQNGVARYYTGLMYAQTGRPDLAFRLWRDLLEQGQPDALWMDPIRSQIMQLAMLAGVDYTLPAPAGAPPFAAPTGGPSAEDIEAAGEMSADDRMRMIDNMVTQLSDRLATEGGTAPEWAQLIGALGVLGETERARVIWEEAQKVFGEISNELQIVREAAVSAGVAE